MFFIHTRLFIFSKNQLFQCTCNWKRSLNSTFIEMSSKHFVITIIFCFKHDISFVNIFRRMKRTVATRVNCISLVIFSWQRSTIIQISWFHLKHMHGIRHTNRHVGASICFTNKNKKKLCYFLLPEPEECFAFLLPRLPQITNLSMNFFSVFCYLSVDKMFEEKH